MGNHRYQAQRAGNGGRAFLAALITLAMLAWVGREPRAQLGSSSLHVPPSYDTLLPPAVGASYFDPAFGSNVKRLSNAPTMANHAGTGMLPFVSTEFPTASPFNSNNSRLILQHGSYFGLYNGSGVYVSDLPFAITASAEPRWSRTDPNVLYYVNGNSLFKFDIALGATSLVRAFGAYTNISGRRESDISRDGSHFVFVGDGRYVFVYDLSSDSAGVPLDTLGHAFHNIYITPGNDVAIGWLANGASRFNGVELFDRNMTFKRQLTHAIGYMHLTTETNGDDVLIWTNSSDPAPIANCANGIVKVRLANAQQTCLLQLDWSLAAHITAPDGNGWAFVATYDPKNPRPEAPAWRAYANELLQVRLDGTETRRLLHHRSRPVNDYGYQPRPSVSRDGTRLVFTSNYGLQAIQSYPTAYTDVYLVEIPEAPPYLWIDDAGKIEGDSGTTELAFNVTLSRVNDQPVSVTYQSADVTAQTGMDYAGVGPTTLTFQPGQTLKTFTVPIYGDLVNENNKTFTVTVTTTAPARSWTSTATGTIRDDDGEPTVTDPTVGSVTADAAVLGGNVTRDGGLAITERGFVFAPSNTNANPVLGGAGVVKWTVSAATGVFASPVNGLTPGTSYTFKAFATNGAGTSYSAVASFTTQLLQSISFGTAPFVLVGGTGSVSATATSALAVTFSTLTPSICTVAGSAVSGVSAGTCTIAADQAGSHAYSPAPQVRQSFSVILGTSIPRLANISTRGRVETGDNIMIGGFVVGGSAPKKIVITARGPSMADLGVADTLADPFIRLFAGSTEIATNDNWQTAPNAAEIQASGFAPTKTAEAAILLTVGPGVPYTVHVTGVAGGTGIALVEVFEVDHPEVPLLNISTRGKVQGGDNVLIGGLIVQGNGPQLVLITARGPSLGPSPFNVPGVLADPTLELYQAGNPVPIELNDNWVDSPNAAGIQATGNAPGHALEAAILRNLQPGAYTAIVRGKNGTAGIGIVEVYAK